MLHDILHISFPLTNPVLIFSLILFIILFAPLLFNKLRIPHLVGLIIAGAIIGPHGLNLMLRDSSITLFGTVGLLYIMFLAGLEIDLAEFKRNSSKSIIFGLYTFIIPMVIGTVAGYYILNFTLISSILLASMFASHTLVAYPILGKFGVTKNRAVTIAIGGTMITDTLALLVLAAIVGMTTGEMTEDFWWRLSMSIIVFSLIVSLLFPLLARWFFKNFNDNISQYVFVLGLVFLAGFLAEASGIEAIIGAFLAGLTLNRLIPNTSALMNRIEFAGNALFIPFFLIGVGMLVDFKAYFQSWDAVIVAFVMTVIAIIGKYSASWLAQKSFNYTIDERRIIFGLSNAQAAATLAAVLVGYNVILGHNDLGEPIRLLNENVLKGSILMILVTCTMASFSAYKGAQNIALSQAADESDKSRELEEKILIPINNIDNAPELINLSVTVKAKSNKSKLYGLNVIDNAGEDEKAEARARKILEKAAICASGTDNELIPIVRYDLNIVNGITNVVKEHKITDLIIGLHVQKGLTDSFLGKLTESILTSCNTTTMIYHPSQPLNTIKRNNVIVPKNAEIELGFKEWFIRVLNLSVNTSSKLIIYAHEATINVMQEINAKYSIKAEYNAFNDWGNFMTISRNFRPDDNLIFVFSRRDGLSYDHYMARIPGYLNKFFKTYNYILIYPKQTVVVDGEDSDYIITPII